MKGFFIFCAFLFLIGFCLIFSLVESTNNYIFIESQSTCKVTISGAVDNPNTFEVSSDTFVIEVIRMAVPKYNADLDSIDKYVFVENNLKISIPYGIININIADLDELCELQGVGAVTAQKIIDYRTITPFRTIEDFKNIGNSIYENNKDRITV